MNLFRIVSGVARKILPKILAPLATGAVSGLGETAIKKSVGGSCQLSPENVKMVVGTPEIREEIKQLLPVAQQKKLFKSFESGSGLVLKTGRGEKDGFLGSLLAGIGIPLIANVVGKLFGGCHGENHEDKYDRLRMFESLLPLIDQNEIDVPRSGNGLIIRPQPTRGGTVIPALKYFLSGNKK